MTCYECCNFYLEGCFGNYSMCMCKIYGSLDCDQNERRPDTAAKSCPNYNITPQEQKQKIIKWNKIPEPFIDF